MPNRTILIVDDNQENLELLSTMLSGRGYELMTAEDAPSAMLRLAQARPALILLDIQLPGIDGLELTRRLKADPNTSEIPILAVTAYAMKGDEERARGAGCNGYLTKPLDKRVLREVVAAHLRA
jgi:CheY-like chemotaxis protein